MDNVLRVPLIVSSMGLIQFNELIEQLGRLNLITLIYCKMLISVQLDVANIMRDKGFLGE